MILQRLRYTIIRATYPTSASDGHDDVAFLGCVRGVRAYPYGNDAAHMPVQCASVCLCVRPALTSLNLLDNTKPSRTGVRI